MKIAILITIVFLMACNGKKQEYRKAEDALDAGREYIQSCLQGDFLKAEFYIVPGNKNKTILAELEKTYREKDKEGRQQLRTASINIKALSEINQYQTNIYFSNSFNKMPDTLVVLKKNGVWLVNISKE